MNDPTQNFDALYIQAGTGLWAIYILLVVMNQFFRKVYWTGSISVHNKRKHDLIQSAEERTTSRGRVLYGMAMLGFASFYRESVEVVRFFQSYRSNSEGNLSYSECWSGSSFAVWLRR